MMDIYNMVTEVVIAKFPWGSVAAALQHAFPPEWEALVRTAEDTTLINVLKYGFPVGYKGPVLTPADHNHTSDLQPPRDVANYVLIEIEEEEWTMLGHFDMEPFVP